LAQRCISSTEAEGSITGELASHAMMVARQGGARDRVRTCWPNIMHNILIAGDFSEQAPSAPLGFPVAYMYQNYERSSN